MFLIYLLILAVTNLFGTLNILEDFRIPGIGKPSDFILVLLNLVVIIKLFTNKLYFNKEEKKFIKINTLILLYVFFLIFYSSVITGIQSFNYALRIGGIYLYYSAFFAPLILLSSKKKLYQFINFIRLGGLVTGSIAIISNVLGYSIVSSVLHSSDYGSFVRVYTPGFFNYFVIIFWTIQFITKKKSKIKIYYIEAIISSLGIILFLSRTRFIVLFFMLITVFYILSFNKANLKKTFGYLSLVSLSFIFAIMIFGFDIRDIIGRFQEGYINTQIGQGTFSYRLYAISIGFGIFLSTPFLGVGFVHPDTNYFKNLSFVTEQKEVYAVTNNADFGLASILFTTGLIGFVLITFFVISFLRRIKLKLNEFIKSNSINIQFIYSLTIFVIVLYVFFIEQLSGNVFGYRTVTLYVISMGVALKVLNSEIFSS